MKNSGCLQATKEVQPRKQEHNATEVKLAMKRFITVLAFALACGLAGKAHAVEANSMLCDAAEMRREAAHMVALARCDRRSTSDAILKCEERSEARYALQLQQLQRREVCGGTTGPPPDPMMCEAKLMHAESIHMACESRCLKRSLVKEGFDLERCNASCGRRYENRVDAIMGRRICEGFGS